MRVIISGASIAGLSAAFWLRRTGHDVVVLERAPRFRDGGQNVDVRGVAKEVLSRMGLTDEIKAHNTTESGTVFVNERGEVTGELPEADGEGATAELEVLRGDFADVLRDALPAGVDIRYDTVIAEVHDSGETVAVVTAAGDRLEADLLVVAEGVRSSTRDLLFDEVDRRELGVTMVFGTIPREPDDTDQWRWLTTTQGRQVHLRPDNHGTTRAILAFRDDEDLAGRELDEVLPSLREHYADVEWQAPRILNGFETSDDLYVDSLTQIRMPAWHRGRVLLVGDAAWCVTPMGGGGASLALTSGYVLAAYLSTSGGDTTAALQRFETWMRPLVDDVQSLPRGIEHFAYPKSRVALGLRRVADKVLTSKPFEPIAAKLTQVAETEHELPELRGVAA